MKSLLSRGFCLRKSLDFYRISTLARASRSPRWLGNAIADAPGTTQPVRSSQPIRRMIRVYERSVVNWCHLEPPRQFLTGPVTELDDDVDIEHFADS